MRQPFDQNLRKKNNRPIEMKHNRQPVYDNFHTFDLMPGSGRLFQTPQRILPVNLSISDHNI